jgi:hypothetical protein
VIVTHSVGNTQILLSYLRSASNKQTTHKERRNCDRLAIRVGDFTNAKTGLALDPGFVTCLDLGLLLAPACSPQLLTSPFRPARRCDAQRFWPLRSHVSPGSREAVALLWSLSRQSRMSRANTLFKKQTYVRQVNIAVHITCVPVLIWTAFLLVGLRLRLGLRR